MNSAKMFSDYLDIMELIAIRESRSIGRYSLKDALGISEGKTRSRLKALLSEGIIKAGPNGASITNKGEIILENELKSKNIKKYIFYAQPILEAGKNNYIFQVGEALRKPIRWVELRDEAIRGGATSSIFIVEDKGKLAVPGVYPDLEEADKNICSFLKTNFHIGKEDLIIIASSQDRWGGLKGGLRVIYILNLEGRSRLTSVTGVNDVL